MNYSSQNFRFNPYNPEFQNNPYPTYEYLRTHDPVHKGILGDWVVTRYADVKFVLKDSRIRSIPVPQNLEKKSHNLMLKEKGNLATAVSNTSQWLFFLESLHHKRLRSLIFKALKPFITQELQGKIQSRADNLIAQIKEKESFDLVQDFAEPLSNLTNLEIIGLPLEDFPLIPPWVTTILLVFDLIATPKTCKLIEQAFVEVNDYIRYHLEEKKLNPKNDLLSALLQIEDGNDRLTDEEIIATCTMLLGAGYNTTTGSITNAVYALLCHPEQLNLLKKQPTIINTAVEELLRYESSVPMIGKMASETVYIGNQKINSGDNISICLASANRDTEQFSHPNSLNLQRKDNQHFAFAGGPHTCLGAGLARLTMPIAINTLLQSFSHLEVRTNQLNYRANLVTRMLTSLPLTFKI